MKILSDDNGSIIAVLLDKKDGKLMVEITTAAISGQALNKRSNAYKLAKAIDDNLPVF